MLTSMTGYGDATYETSGMSLTAEVKSLNNRFLKTSIKVPDMLAFVEPAIERLIRDELSRGSVTFLLQVRFKEDQKAFEVNTQAVQQVIGALEQINACHRGTLPLQVDLAGVLQLPGICQSHAWTEQEQQDIADVVRELTIEALAGLRRMREDEGRGLYEDLQLHCQSIAAHLDQLTGLTDGVLEAYHDRLKQRVAKLLREVEVALDEEVLAREVAIYAERCDINEEVSRLSSHLQQFEEVCRSDDRAGRRLEFITQEMLREANTIASKANDAAISQHILEIKVAIDRLKEQVQNAE